MSCPKDTAPKQQSHGGAQSSSGIDAQQRGVGQRVAKEGLHHRSPYGQRGTGQQGREELGQTMVQHDEPRRTLPFRLGECLPHFLYAQMNTAHQQIGQSQQEHQSQKKKEAHHGEQNV